MITNQQIREVVLDRALKPENINRFEGILKVTAAVHYESMILASLEVSGSGVRKYNGVVYEEGIRFSQESYMDEGHSLEWGMWEA